MGARLCGWTADVFVDTARACACIIGERRPRRAKRSGKNVVGRCSGTVAQCEQNVEIKKKK